MGYYEPYDGLREVADAMQHAFVARGQVDPWRTARRTRAACGRKPIRRLCSEPRPRGQPPRRSTRDQVGVERAMVAAAIVAFSPSTPLCSKARNGEHRTPSASSPTSLILSLPRPCAAGGARSSRGSTGSTRCLIRCRRRRSLIATEWRELDRPPHQRLLDWHRDLRSRCVERGQSSQTVAAISCPSTRSTTTCSVVKRGRSHCWR
jgi:hypothetical protein